MLLPLLITGDAQKIKYSFSKKSYIIIAGLLASELTFPLAAKSIFAILLGEKLWKENSQDQFK